VRWKAILKEVRTFSAHCCNINSGGIMGVAKEPVIRFTLNPNPVCLTASISWSLVNSYAPGSTITAWEVDWDDTTTDSGVNIATASGTHTYGMTGTYQVEVTITEGLGKTQTATYEVNVLECGETKVVGSWTYASTDGSGVFYINWTEASPDWAAVNGGLSGDALYVRSMVIDPATQHLPYPQHNLWIATLDGVYSTPNSGGEWFKQELNEPSNVEFNDTPAATLIDLDFKQVVIFSGVLYVAATHKTLNRLWIYRSDDYGASWINRGVYV
jgi:hypothetical protein